MALRNSVSAVFSSLRNWSKLTEETVHFVLDTVTSELQFILNNPPVDPGDQNLYSMVVSFFLFLFLFSLFPYLFCCLYFKKACTLYVLRNPGDVKPLVDKYCLMLDSVLRVLHEIPPTSASFVKLVLVKKINLLFLFRISRIFRTLFFSSNFLDHRIDFLSFDVFERNL